MDINFDNVFNQIMSAAEGSFKEGWAAVRQYAPAEFKKMALQIEDIAKNVAAYEADNQQGYSPETGKILLQMQRTACEGVLVATSHLTLIAVQKALNAIMDVLKNALGGVLKTIL